MQVITNIKTKHRNIINLNKIKKVLRPFLSIKYAICYFIAWYLINGWSYTFVTIGSFLNIKWMKYIGGIWLTFLWMPFTPEKIVIIPLSIWFRKVLFKEDKSFTEINKWLM